MIRILLAVNDSPAGLAAARTAIWLAQQAAGTIRAVHVLDGPESVSGQRESAPAEAEAEDRRPPTVAPVLRYASGLADRAGVGLEGTTVRGQPARSILDQAAAWDADVIVLGRSGVRHVGQPFVGSSVLNVLEFAEVPVVVVPAPK
jgi:nucleotide-binding universal stress UspA family protein